MAPTDTLSFFLGHLVQTTHLTSADSTDSGLRNLLAYRTALRRHRGQDLDVALMALAAARQGGQTVAELADWVRRLCERVLCNPEAVSVVNALLEQTPMAGSSDAQLDWYLQTLERLRTLSRPAALVSE